MENKNNVRTFFNSSLKQTYIKTDLTTGEVEESNDIETLYYNPVSVCERSAYKPPRSQVLDFLNAGERLLASRKEMYFQSQIDKPDVNGDLQLPLTRSKTDYDMLDAYRDLKSYNNKLKEYERLVNERKMKKAEEDKKLFEEFQKWKAENTPKSFPDLPVSNDNT